MKLGYKKPSEKILDNPVNLQHQRKVIRAARKCLGQPVNGLTIRDATDLAFGHLESILLYLEQCHKALESLLANDEKYRKRIERLLKENEAGKFLLKSREHLPEECPGCGSEKNYDMIHYSARWAGGWTSVPGVIVRTYHCQAEVAFGFEAETSKPTLLGRHGCPKQFSEFIKAKQGGKES